MTLERTCTGPKPAIRLPAGAVDTQMHMYLPGFPAVDPGPPVPEGLPGPAEYARVMDWLGIDRVVITQGNAHQFDNANLLAGLAAMGACARGVAAIRPDTADAELAALHAAGVRGARIMDLPGGAAGLPMLAGVDARAAAMGWCIAVQFDGNRILDHLELLAGLRSRWILDHHGKFFAGAAPDSPEIDAVRRLLDRGNCWFKFAGVYEILAQRPAGLCRRRGGRPRDRGGLPRADHLGHELAAQPGQDDRRLSGRRRPPRHRARLGARGRARPRARRQPQIALRFPAHPGGVTRRLGFHPTLTPSRPKQACTRASLFNALEMLHFSIALVLGTVLIHWAASAA